MSFEGARALGSTGSTKIEVMGAPDRQKWGLCRHRIDGNRAFGSAGSIEIVVMSVPPLQNTADLESDPERNSNIPIKHDEFDHLGKVRFPGTL